MTPYISSGRINGGQWPAGGLAADFVVTDDKSRILAVAEFVMTDDRRVGLVSTV